jgi:hypothetical protein
METLHAHVTGRWQSWVGCSGRRLGCTAQMLCQVIGSLAFQTLQSHRVCCSEEKPYRSSVSPAVFTVRMEPSRASRAQHFQAQQLSLLGQMYGLCVVTASSEMPGESCQNPVRVQGGAGGRVAPPAGSQCPATWPYTAIVQTTSVSVLTWEGEQALGSGAGQAGPSRRTSNSDRQSEMLSGVIRELSSSGSKHACRGKNAMYGNPPTPVLCLPPSSEGITGL